MSRSRESFPDVQLSADNIGGIDSASETISPGVTVLVGENATNRTSLLQAIAAALGADSFSLKRDADSGEATLTVGEKRYTCRLRRTNSHVATDGEPYLDEPELAELYAILFGSNEVRRTVREGGDIRDLIVEPLDVAEINDRIEEIVARRREIDRQLDQYDRVEEQIEQKRSQRQEYEEQLAELDEELERERASLEAAQQAEDSQRQSEIEAELETKLETLRDCQADLEQVEENLAVEQKALESFRTEREELQAEYEQLSEPDEQTLATLEERVEQLRTQKRSLESTMSELQQVIRFNEERLSGASPLAAAEQRPQLELTDQQTVCWTCGSEVDTDRIEQTLDRLRDLHQQHSSERNRIATEIEETADRLSALEAEHDQYRTVASQLADLAEKIERRAAAVEQLEGRQATLEDRIQRLEDTVADLKTNRHNEVLELQERVSELEFEHRRVTEKLEDIDAEIEQLRGRSTDRAALEAEREELSAELTELRTRVERLEAEAIEAFNTHMAAILEHLEYDNIERIWIDQSQRDVEGPDALEERVFELHVVRAADDGAVYEDSFEHLSESERELVGLVVALSGYLAHDASEHVPFMLLDSLEMIDGQRLVELAAYLEQYVPYLVMVLLPDHAAAFADHEQLPDHEISDI